MTAAAKSLLAAAMIAAWLRTQDLLLRRRPGNAAEIGDALHRLTRGLNARLNSSPAAADALLIASTLLIDALGLYLFGRGILGSSVRPLLALALVFALRQANQLVTALPAPPGMIWRDPGVPSLFVTYRVSNDLFFSGHTALACLAALELARAGNPALTAFAALALAFEAGAVLVLRAHWTMDVFAGAAAAAWAAAAAARLAPAADAWLSRLS